MATAAAPHGCIWRRQWLLRWGLVAQRAVASAFRRHAPTYTRAQGALRVGGLVSTAPPGLQSPAPARHGGRGGPQEGGGGPQGLRRHRIRLPGGAAAAAGRWRRAPASLMARSPAPPQTMQQLVRRPSRRCCKSWRATRRWTASAPSMKRWVGSSEPFPIEVHTRQDRRLHGCCCTPLRTSATGKLQPQAKPRYWQLGLAAAPQCARRPPKHTRRTTRRCSARSSARTTTSAA